MEGGIFLVEVHIVQKGETLWKIARHFGISFEELKRVNGHLANPDYVVPGMKIFLPEKSATTGKEMEKKPSKGAAAVKKTEKEPNKVADKVAPPPVEVKKEPVKPKPTPAPKPTQEKPKAPVVPKQPEAPKVPEAAPMPQIPQMHPMPPMQPMQPQMQFYGVPCGWMPIFDADCYPFVQPGHMQQAMPMAAPQLPVEPETSMHINVKPMAKPTPKPMPHPTENTMPDGWKLLESPELQFEEGANFKKLPQIHFEESPMSKDEAKVEEQVEETRIPIPTQPQFQMPMAQESPMQGGWQMGQQGQLGYQGHSGSPGGYAAYPQAGCGQGQTQPYPQMNPCSGCGQYHPMPAPVQHSNHCNACNQPIQAMPRQMMPYPQQNNNWPGTY